MPKQTVAVLFGGRSVEHEVSVISAHQVMDALDVAGYQLLPIFIDKSGSWFAGRGLYDLKRYADPGFRPDSLRDVHRVSLSPDTSVRELVLHPQGAKGFFYRAPVLWADVFFPVLHGSFGEDGRLQGLLELADVPYVGCGVLASAVGMDKVEQKHFFRRAGLPVLDCIEIPRRAWAADPAAFIETAESRYGYPMMVKPCSLGSSIAIARCASRDELTAAVRTALLFDDRVLIERALAGFKEINCSVLGPPARASVCEMPVADGELLTFDTKYRAGGKKSAKAPGGISKSGMASLNRRIPAPISDELASRVQDYAIAAFNVIGGHGIVRADFLLDADGHSLYLNEINTIPGSLSFYLWEASGVPFDQLVAQVIEGALARHRDKRETRFSLDVNLLGGARL